MEAGEAKGNREEASNLAPCRCAVFLTRLAKLAGVHLQGRTEGEFIVPLQMLADAN